MVGFGVCCCHLDVVVLLLVVLAAVCCVCLVFTSCGFGYKIVLCFGFVALVVLVLRFGLLGLAFPGLCVAGCYVGWVRGACLLLLDLSGAAAEFGVLRLCGLVC